MSHFLQAEWRKLVMFNYPVEPELLKPYVPPFTELDIWQGTCYVSLVGFMFLNTKVKGVRVPFHVNFEEINLRFYVKYNDPQLGIKRGVVFIREIVPKHMISWVANTLYREHYITLPMFHKWDISPQEMSIIYGLKKHGITYSFSVEATHTPLPLISGSEAEFITEHFWGYAKWDDHTSNEYEVGHPRWNTYQVTKYQINFDFAAIYGKDFKFLNDFSPKSVFLAEGSEIFVNKGKIISK